MKLFQWHFGFYLIPLAFLLPVSNAQANPIPGVTCQAGMNTAAGSTGIVNFGTITGANANNAKATGTLSYSCTNNSDTAGFVSVCFAADGGQYTPSAVTTTSRYMQRINNDTTGRLRFTMTHSKSNTLWGTRSFGSGFERKLPSFAIGANSTITGIETINFSLTSAVNNTKAGSGTYTNDFGAGHTALTVVADTNSTLADCLQPTTPGLTRFPFTVKAAITPSCSVITTSNPNVNLGPHSASKTNITGSNSSAITVNCTNGGAYYIGLAPSSYNGVVSNVGAGFMSGTGSNLDKVPYQLRSTAGINGTIWGNTATSTTVGNGVADFGTGSNKSHTVFVTVPSADFKPDNYSDTVTIKVNY